MSDISPSFVRDVVFPSGNVEMPWSWWNQFAPVVISSMKCGDASLERKIVSEVASYGRQIGRISEALSVLVDHLPASGLSDEEKRALSDFREMAAAVAAVKAGSGAPTPQSLQGILAVLDYWKEHHNAFYRKVRSALLKQMEDEDKPALKSAR